MHMYNMSEACCNIHVVKLQLVSVGKLRGCTLMVRSLHRGSLSGVPYRCVRLPIHISGGSTGESHGDWKETEVVDTNFYHSCVEKRLPVL